MGRRRRRAAVLPIPSAPGAPPGRRGDDRGAAVTDGNGRAACVTFGHAPAALGLRRYIDDGRAEVIDGGTAVTNVRPRAGVRRPWRRTCTGRGPSSMTAQPIPILAPHVRGAEMNAGGAGNGARRRRIRRGA